MKSLADLKAIREKTKDSVIMRHENPNITRVIVGMGTCGIAAGARTTLHVLLEEASRLGLDNVIVSQTGCAGMCRLEPVVEVFAPGKEKVTYVKVSAAKAVEIVSKHLANGTVIEEYTVGAAQ